MSVLLNTSSQSMPLSKVMPGAFLEANTDPMITGLCSDSRKIKTGNLFVALNGYTIPGSCFAKDAVASGAAAVLSEDLAVNALQLDVPVEVDLSLPENLSAIAGVFYGEPSQSLDVIGITGTNGKTSCCYWLAWVLEQLGAITGQIGTLGAGVGHELQLTGFTTPDAIQVQELLAGCKQAGAEAVVMEVSSHGLDQGRVDAVHFDSAIFTNLSQDHLDYHANMDEYFQAKIKLFQTEGLKRAIVNLDEKASHRIVHELSDSVELISYSIENAKADLFLSNIQPTDSGYQAKVDGRWGQAELNLPVFGEYNLSNLLAVAATALVKGYEFSDVMAQLQNIPSVPGRMQSLSVGSSPEVIIDYAHTPDAVQSVLTALRPQTKGRLISVLGCGGDRDAGKRPLMALATIENSDVQVFTADNPRSENVAMIVDDMLSGLDDKRLRSVSVIEDRKEAIRAAIEMASSEDVVAVLGKGHEVFQEIHGQKIPFSDAEVCLQSLNEVYS